jgi:hypothetical protein
MRRPSILRPVDRMCLYSSDAGQIDQLGPATLRAGSFLAILFLLFAITFTLFVPATLEQRIGSFVFFGLIPAVGFYAGSRILSQLLRLSSRLCEMIAGYCFRRSAVLARCLLSTLFVLSQKIIRSLPHGCWRAYAAFVEFLCLLIRSTARLFIGMQAVDARGVSDGLRGGWGLRRLVIMSILLTAFGLGWRGGNSTWLLDLRRERPTVGPTIDAVVERIIRVESNGDPNLKNKRSSATGLGQFLDETWLDLIRTHRPDLARGRSQGETLELRRDAKVAREITTRFTEQNAETLRKRGLSVTPGTLYLAHFAGGAGAVAILSALEDADAASVMASAGRTKREKIVKANPFLDRLTVADLRNWADRKMRVPGS